MIPQVLRLPRPYAWLWGGMLLALFVLVGLLPGSSAAGGATAPTFAPPVYVDQQLAGGEPEV